MSVGKTDKKYKQISSSSRIVKVATGIKKFDLYMEELDRIRNEQIFNTLFFKQQIPKVKRKK